jgi:hypothetical protein
LRRREEEKTRGAAALQGIEEDSGRREEGDERSQEMGGRWWCVRVGKAGGWRWKEAPTGGPHLLVSQRERRRWIGPGGAAGPGRACWAGREGKKIERGREERGRGGGAGYREKEREFFSLQNWVLHVCFGGDYD